MAYISTEGFLFVKTLDNEYSINCNAITAFIRKGADVEMRIRNSHSLYLKGVDYDELCAVFSEFSGAPIYKNLPKLISDLVH